MNFITNIINGMSVGGLYAMIALGYTMVYGIAKMLNFAHGDVITVGGYLVILISTNILAPALNLPVWIGFILSIILCALIGVFIEKVAYKPLRSASSLSVLITAIGVSYFLQNLLQLLFSASTKTFPVNYLMITIKIFEGLEIQLSSIITLFLSIIIMILLSLFIKKTKTGRAMLAVSEDKDAAKLMGININRTITITFAIGSALAAIAGICYGFTYSAIVPTTGAMPGIKAFIAAVLGGIGSVPGAMLGGIILGLIEYLSKIYISSQWSDAIVFGILIIVLLVKPTGLLGKKRNEKV